VVLPIVLAVLLTISLQVLMGTALTLFHILSLLLVVGMGLDYSLFFNRPLSDVQDLNMRTHGVMMSAASTLAAFGVLAFAGIPVLAAMGQTVSIGVLCCYVLSQWLAEPEHELAPVQQDRTTV
jgi:predicted exporter